VISAHIWNKHYHLTVTAWLMAGLSCKVRASAVFVKTRIVALSFRNEKDVTVIHYWLWLTGAPTGPARGRRGAGAYRVATRTAC